MQYVNDDMDDVFRKAADNYPLDTKSADWNKVLSALQGENNVASPTADRKNKNGRLLWLLLLVPFGLICNKLYSPGSSDKSAPTETAAIKQQPAGKEEDKAKRNTGSPANTGFSAGNIEDPDPIQKIGSDNPAIADVPSKARLKSDPGFSAGKQGEKGRAGYTNRSRNDQSDTEDIRLYSGQKESSFRNYVFRIFFARDPFGQPTGIMNRNLASIKNPYEMNGKQVPASRQKKFYAGLVGGIDVTTVKFQKVENKGTDYGVLLGYQFNRKWSIESGVYLANKYYYTDGKYLNTSKIYMPPNAWIDEASGDCKMIEVPVSVRYNFAVNKKSTWFSTLGTSSYFMKEEKYVYQYYYGSAGPVPHGKKYKNSSNNLFSNISVSGGYTHRLGNVADLRIEPYVKIPISGMGIAKLPLFSTGVHVGITKKF